MGQNAGLYTQGIGVVGKTYGAFQATQATKTALSTQAAVDDANAQIDQQRASDALNRGARTVQASLNRTAQIKGTQVARLAANGVALDGGSALDLLTSTDMQGQVDARTAQTNAENEAWAYRVGATNDSGNAALLRNRASSTSPYASAFSTLLTGAGSVASYWSDRNKSVNGTPKGGD